MTDTSEKVRSFSFSRTGYRGVFWDASKQRYRAEIGNRDRGTRKRLGVFPDPKAAAEAYDIAAMEMYGEAAVLNFPLSGYRNVIDCRDGPPPMCASGHRMDDANTYVDPLGRRQCRECNRQAAKRYHEKKRASIISPPK